MEVIQVVLRLPSFSFLPSHERCFDCYRFYDYPFMITRSVFRDPDSFFLPPIAIKFAFPARVSNTRRWITAHPDAWPMWDTLMDCSLRDSWFRNYRVFLRFLNHFCWNWIEIVQIFSGFCIVCLSFFWRGKGVLWYCLNLGKMMVNDSWIALNFTWNKEEELFWTFLYERKFLYFFFLFSSFLILNRIHVQIAIRTERICCISCIKGISSV